MFDEKFYCKRKFQTKERYFLFFTLDIIPCVYIRSYQCFRHCKVFEYNNPYKPCVVNTKMKKQYKSMVIVSMTVESSYMIQKCSVVCCVC